MTRKDYIALAAALKEVRRIAKERDARTGRETARYIAWEAVDTIACFLEDDNPRFDKSRFVEATMV